MQFYDERSVLLEKKPQKIKRFCSHLRQFKLEPSLFAVLFGCHLSLPIIPNQLLRQACLVNNYNISDCLQIDKIPASEIEERIQPTVAKVLMAIEVLEVFIPGILITFLGLWMDKY